MTPTFSKESAINKRTLSLEEKSSLSSFSGKAIILPGGCGSNENPLEFEELLMAGFTEEQIIGFEEKPYIRRLLKNHYKKSQILSDINKNIVNIDNDSISYIHLDFLRAITQHTFSKAKFFSSILKDNSRFRITVGSNWGRGRGAIDNYQIANIKNISYEIFIPLCKKIGVNQYKISQVEKEISKYFFTRPHPEYMPINHKEASGSHDQLGIAMFLFCTFAIRTSVNYSNKWNVLEAKCAIENLNNKKYAYYTLNNIKQLRYKKDNDKYTLPMYTSWFTVNKQKTDIVYLLNELCDFILTPMETYDCNSN